MGVPLPDGQAEKERTSVRRQKFFFLLALSSCKNRIVPLKYPDNGGRIHMAKMEFAGLTDNALPRKEHSVVCPSAPAAARGRIDINVCVGKIG